MFPVQEKQKNFHSFSHSWHTQPRLGFFPRRMQFFFLPRGSIIFCTMPEMDGKHLPYENFTLLSLWFVHKRKFPLFRGNRHTSLSSRQVILLMAKKVVCSCSDKTGCCVGYIQWFRAFHPGAAESYLSQKACLLFSSNGKSAKGNMNEGYYSSGNKLF